MASSISLVSLLSAGISVCALILVILIFRRVYQEEYRRPWLFIGVSAIFFAVSELLRFVSVYFGRYIINSDITSIIIYFLAFISISFLTYGLLLEYLVLNYIKGKFVKMKLIPVQEGSIDGKLEIDVTKGKSYLALKKEKPFMLEQFSQATKSGYEGFLLTEMNPREVRTKFSLPKTPIAWINQIENSTDSQYVKDSLDENSDLVDPLQINNIISFIDNFLERSNTPFVVIDLNLLIKVSNFSIVNELLNYVSSKVNKKDGVLICMVNTDVLSKSNIEIMKEYLLELE